MNLASAASKLITRSSVTMQRTIIRQATGRQASRRTGGGGGRKAERLKAENRAESLGLRVESRSNCSERLELRVETRRTRRREEKLQAAAKRQRINLATLPEQKSAPEKVQLAARMKTTTSVSNQWLAERLQMDELASVSQYVRRRRAIDSTPTDPRLNLASVIPYH